MSMKAKKQLEKTEQEIQRLEREVETLRDSKPPREACQAFVIGGARRPLRAPAAAAAHNHPTNPSRPRAQLHRARHQAAGSHVRALDGREPQPVELPAQPRLL